MSTTIKVDANHLNGLDLSPAQAVIDKWISEGSIAAQGQQIRFEIDFPREPEDPRELSEIPEVRLWFIRLDARYPWLPYLLDWEAGELGRYTAMLVPHQFSPTEGIQFNPEALEIFVMGKVFVLIDWLQQQNSFSRTKVKFLTQMVGYEIDDAFFDLIGA
ncbi:CRR6 family NdhI maturation factor [Leptolyngbya ohadii]|uniref:CRR6 family NdhI maturation factor n=1 Tax=Leptolyngbya ohadii TaxID=1962290 RepID=UPI000B599A62|nr:CRR6 family NdhI maturation factor [Leptolyngbya ohadii]